MFIYFFNQEVDLQLECFRFAVGNTWDSFQRLKKSEIMFPFGFCSVNIGQGLGEYDFDLAGLKELKKPVVTVGFR